MNFFCTRSQFSAMYDAPQNVIFNLDRFIWSHGIWAICSFMNTSQVIVSQNILSKIRLLYNKFSHMWNRVDITWILHMDIISLAWHWSKENSWTTISRSRKQCNFLENVIHLHHNYSSMHVLSVLGWFHLNVIIAT